MHAQCVPRKNKRRECINSFRKVKRRNNIDKGTGNKNKTKRSEFLEKEIYIINNCIIYDFGNVCICITFL